MSTSLSSYQSTAILVFLGWTVLNAIIAHSRGRSVVGYFLLSFLISPLFAFLMLIISRDPTYDSTGRPRFNYPTFFMALILVPTAGYIIYTRIISPRDRDSSATAFASATPALQTSDPRPHAPNAALVSTLQAPQPMTAQQRAMKLYPELAVPPLQIESGIHPPVSSVPKKQSRLFQRPGMADSPGRREPERPPVGTAQSEGRTGQGWLLTAGFRSFFCDPKAPWPVAMPLDTSRACHVYAYLRIFRCFYHGRLAALSRLSVAATR